MTRIVLKRSPIPIAGYGNVRYLHSMPRKVTTTIYITEEQQQALKLLNERSKVPVAEYIRQGIDLVLERYSHLIPGQLELGSSLPLGNSADTLPESPETKLNP